MIKRLACWLVQHRQGSAAAVITLSSFALLTKVLSLVQQALMARLFGISHETDAYFVAQAMPMLIGGLVFSSVSTCLTRDFVHARDTARVRGMLLLVGAGSLLFTAVLELTSAPVVGLLGRGLDAATFRSAVSLSRLMAVMFVLYSVSGVMQAYCYAQSTFVVPAAAGLFPYLGGIGGALFLHTRLGIRGLVAGSLAGLAVQALLVSGPYLLRPPSTDGSLRRATQAVRGQGAVFARSLALIFLSLLVSQLYFITDRAVASWLGPGWVAGFGFAASIFSMPLQLIVLSVSNAFLPALSRLAGEKRTEELARRVDDLMWTVIFLVVPLTLFLYLGSVPVTRILFQGNAFKAGDTALTAAILQVYSLGLVGFALKDIATSVLVACRREVWPAGVGLVCIAAHTVAALALAPIAGHLGIAAATAAIFAGNAAFLMALVARSTAVSWGVGWRRSGWKMAVAGLGMGLAYGLARQLPVPAAGLAGLFAQFARLGAASIVYLLVCALLGLRELEALWARYLQPRRTLAGGDSGVLS